MRNALPRRALRATPRGVLMTTDTLGGVLRYAVDLSSALCAHGIDVTLATFGRPLEDAERARLAAISRLTLLESDLKLEWMDDPWSDVDLAGKWLLHIERHVVPDIVHLNGYTHAALPWRCPPLVVAHSCVFSWWKAVHRGRPPPRYDRYYASVRAGLSAAAEVVAPTRTMLACLEEHYGPLSRARVVPNGTEPWADDVVKEPFVLCAGRLWDEAKNVAALLRVAPRLQWPVLVAGERARPEGGEAALEGAVGLGALSRDEMSRYLARASIYCHPARYEPFGLAPLEAAVRGCALVLGDIPSLREVWGNAALYVPPDDCARLEDALSALISDPVLLGALAERARRRAERFTLERMVNAYLAIYDELLAKEPRAPRPPLANTSGAEVREPKPPAP